LQANSDNKPVGALDLPSALAPSVESVNTKPLLYAVAPPVNGVTTNQPKFGVNFGVLWAKSKIED